MLRPVLMTAPVAEPVTLAEAKAHARVDYDDDDSLIEGLIDAAIAHVDGYSGILGRCMITQTWTQPFIEWGAWLRLPFADVQSVAVKYRDKDDVEQTLAASNYELIEDSRSAILIYRDAFSTPSLNGDRHAPISVEVTAGYGDAASDVPESIRHAMLLLVGHWYESREAVVVGAPVTDLPMAVDALLMPHRRVGV